MNPARSILIVLSLLLLLLPGTLLAHSGEKHDDHAMEQSPVDSSIYAVEQDEIPLSELDDPFGSSLSRSSLDMDDDPIDAGMPMMEGMDHSAHMEQQKTVELAHHELVSPPQKGYYVAVAITLLSGLVYGILVFKKPGE